MADKKISALTGAATPLAGTEVLPIVQSGATVKVAVNDLTAGKTVNGSNFIASSSFGAGGTTPTAGWNTAVFQTQNASFNSNNGQDLRLYQNIYYDGANYRYITANPGGFMLQYQNETEWFRSTDGSPAAGGVANATSVVKFTTTGNVNVSNGNVVIGTAGKGITTGSAIPLGFGTNNSVTAAKIDTSSNFLIAKTDADFAAVGFEYLASSKILRNTASGGAAVQVNRLASDGDIVVFFRNTVSVGSISVTTTGTAYNIISDARLKHDIVDAPDAADLIDALQVRSFKWNVDDSEQRYGFVAQELLEVAPEAVTVPEDEDKMMGVDYSKLVPMLVKEVQSLRARVAQLEGK